MLLLQSAVSALGVGRYPEGGHALRQRYRLLPELDNSGVRLSSLRGNNDNASLIDLGLQPVEHIGDTARLQ